MWFHSVLHLGSLQCKSSAAVHHVPYWGYDHNGIDQNIYIIAVIFHFVAYGVRKMLTDPTPTVIFRLSKANHT